MIPAVKATTDGSGLDRSMRGLVVHRTAMGVVAAVMLDPDGLGVLYAPRLTIIMEVKLIQYCRYRDRLAFLVEHPTAL
jgi:hypothetical protein